jgi:hypothetical protein
MLSDVYKRSSVVEVLRKVSILRSVEVLFADGTPIHFGGECTESGVEVPLNDPFGDADDSESAIRQQCRNMKDECVGVK